MEEKIYQIRANYDSGDSFDTYPNQEAIIEIEWKILDNAKANLQRIKEHYQYHLDTDSWGITEEKRKQEELKAASKDWFNKNNNHTIVLYTDEGKPFSFWPQWIGYFESLNYCEIVIKQEDLDDMRIEF